MGTNGSSTIYSYDAADRWLVAMVGGACIVLTIIIAVNLDPLWLAGAILISIITWYQFKKKIPGHTITLNLPSSTFSLSTTSGVKTGKLSEVQQILYVTEYIDEYASAFKSSSAEYRGTIQFQLKNGEPVDIFRFTVDSEEVPPEVREISNSLNELIE